METREDYEDRMREEYSDVIGALVQRGFHDTDIALQGGGCLAIRIELGPEWFALITDEDEPLVGQPRPHGWNVGLYGQEPDTGFCRDDYTGNEGYNLYRSKNPDVQTMVDAIVPLLTWVKR